MAATFISTEAVTLSAGSATITVPSDCTAVYVSVGFYNAVGGAGLNVITLNGAAPDQAVVELPVGGSAEPAISACGWYNPATGSRTLAISFDTSPPTEGPNIFATYVKDGDTTAWRDVDLDQDISTNAITVTLTTVTNDLVFKHDMNTSGTPPSLSASWTSAQTQTVASKSSRVSYIVASGSSQVCNGENENFSALVAWSIGAGTPATSVGPIAMLAQRNRRHIGRALW